MKYRGFTSSGCRNIGIRKLWFLAKTQFLLAKKEWENEKLDELSGSKFAIIELCKTEDIIAILSSEIVKKNILCTMGKLIEQHKVLKLT